MSDDHPLSAVSSPIVVGVDGSPAGAAALRWALRYAERTGGEVAAIFAWQMPFLSIPGAFDRQEMEKAAKALLVAAVADVDPSPSVPVWPFVAEGDATKSLLEASSHGAELLVVGSRGRGLITAFPLGSVCQGCAANATCPVVVVKATGEADPPADSQG